MSEFDHVGKVIQLVEKALAGLDGVSLQAVHSQYGANEERRTSLSFEVIINHHKFKHAYEELHERDLEGIRQEFLKILDDGA